MQTLLCAAILFDLDGVLVSSTQAVSRQWRRWSVEHNINPEEALHIAHGRRAAEVIALLAPDLDAHAEVKVLEQREADDVDGVAIMPGAMDLVSSAPQDRWGVVTSGTRHLALSRLSLAGIPVPRVLATADDVVHGKPHPEPYLKGAQLLGYPPQKCVVIEDAPAGIEAAHRAGMRVIALPSTYPASALEGADVIVGSLASITVARIGQDGEFELKVED
ncbi:MAG: HAD family hydrolase [Acidobacteriales bacterium]|nr:HAD family hydrolase [Terriglobales bacterium]